MTVLQLAFAILLSAALPNGHPPAHFRRHPLGAEGYSQALAQDYLDAARVVGLPSSAGVALAALGRAETNHNGKLVSRIGAMGIMQLHPRYTLGKRYKRTQGQPQAARDRENIYLGAEALRYGLDKCHNSLARAIGWYRTGRCIVGPRTRAVLAIRRRMLHYAGM